MCGCEAHHTVGKPCTCTCAPAHHVAIQQGSPEYQARFGPPEEDPVPPRWARVLGLEHHSDDDSILVNTFYSRQVNTPTGYVADEVVLSHQWWAWALGIEFERPDSDLHQHQWTGVTLRLGPFSLTASRQRGGN